MSQALNPPCRRALTRQLSGYFTVLAALLLTIVAPGAYAAAACNIVYTVTPQNASAFGAAITIQNTGTTAVTSWTLAWAFANGQTITSLWNGAETQSGANVTVTNESYNGSIAAGGSLAGMGFNGTWNGTINSVPAAFSLNGTACSVNGVSPISGSFTLKPSAATLSIVQGTSVTDTITVTDVSPFTGSVTLTATGLPAGVTAAFATNPTASTSVLTLTASSTATVGAATVTITGTSGTQTATTTIALTVPAKAGFTLTPSASSLSVTPGSSAIDTITVTDLGGFTGSVTLAASGLPTGLTAAFSTNPTTGTSVITLTDSSTTGCTGGTSTITITGISGALTATTTIALTVAVPAQSFTLSPSARALSVIQGSSATDTITLTEGACGTANVTLAASGLPSGVTVAFGTNPATTTSVVTFTASSTATVGVSTVTITGISGALSVNTTIALTVTASSKGSFTLGTSSSTMSVVQGSTATDTVTVIDVSPFTGSVTLVATNLPSGVTAAFATNPATATSVITLTASSTATTGAATITITGTSGTLTSSTPITVTVMPASSSGFACGIVYNVSAQSSSEFGGAFTISNTGTTAWTSWTLTWAFANGQTISSFWNGIETQSGANVTVASESYNGALAAGASATNIGFDATWNGVTNKIPASFSINGTACTLAPSTSGSFTLAASAPSLSMTQGGTATDTLTVTDIGASVGTVSLSAAGLPSGVTAAFGTNPATSTSVLTLTASGTATTGGDTVTITGTNGSGTVTATATIALTVNLPTPVISWVSPSSGVVGSSMNIMPGGALGNAPFGATQGTSAVYFGTTAATVTSWAVNSVEVTVPNVAIGASNVTVVVNGQTSNAVPFTVTSAVPAAAVNTGNSTWFSALGTPYGGCGVPQQYLDSQYFVALNVQNDPANYTLFLSRPISSTFASDIGLWNNGANCGRWVHITIGDFCEGTNDGMQDAAFCRGGTGWVADQFTGAQLDLVVADSCQDGNAWCRDDPYHLDQAEGALNQYVLNGAPVGDMNPTYFNNRQISWYFELPPNYTGDINIGMLQSSTSAWTAISVTHLPNGIHGLQYLSGGVWTPAVMDGDMGEDFLISPTVAGGANYEIQVYDITNTLINSGRIYSFTYPAAACGTDCTAAFTPVTYTTSQ